jgi:hypothetical protein
MSAIVSSEKRPGYLLIKCLGSMKNVDELRVFSQLIYEEIIKDNYTRILLRNDVSLPVNPIEYYELVKSYAEDLPDDIRMLKLANVVKPEHHEMIKFWETVCVNRGYNFHGFISEEEGVKWLIQD